MTIPLHTFVYGGSEYMAYPQNPPAGTRWLEENAKRFLYAPAHIIREAVPYTFDGIPTRGAGIYFLLADDAIVYVGLANCLHRRIPDHNRIGRTFNRFWCFGGILEMYLADIEAFYIHTLRPPLNKKYPAYFDDIEPFIESALKGTLEYPNV